MRDSLRIAKVIAVHPEAVAVDLLFTDDGSTVPMVRVLVPFGSTNTGLVDLATPTPPASGNPQDPTPTGNRDIYAGVLSFMGRPVVVGFFMPQANQLLFADTNRRVDRHASDVYTTITDSGDVETYHPSGTYLRIGASPTHEDLTGRDLNGQWKIARNTGAAPHVHLTVANAGATVATFDVDPSGNITLTHNGNLTVNTTGNLSATIGGTAAINATTSITMTAPTITLAGTVHLGGAGGVPAAQQGTVDTGGFSDVSNLATKVFVT